MVGVVDPDPDIEEGCGITDGVYQIGDAHGDTQVDEDQGVAGEDQDDGDRLRGRWVVRHEVYGYQQQHIVHGELYYGSELCHEDRLDGQVGLPQDNIFFFFLLF